MEHIAEFIKQHSNDDVRRLALEAGRYPGIDMRYAVEQIQGLQKARTKLPSWAKCEGIVFPPHISMEQCSSEQTALYKLRVLQRVVRLVKNADETAEINHFTDITGGFGVDFSYLARDFECCAYVEQQPHLCDIARHNFPLLGLERAEIVNGDGTEAEIRGVIFADPARRDVNGKRTFAIADCTPDILSLVDGMMKMASVVIIKLSPMLDWHATVADINSKSPDCVREVHIVSTGNECKELLLVLSKRYDSKLTVHCVNDDSVFCYCPDDNGHGVVLGHESIAVIAQDDEKTAVSSDVFLLMPNASIMKAGCFALLSECFPVRQVAANSHVFLSSSLVDDFPGKQYEIISVCSMNKKELRECFRDITKANISTRNFPMNPQQLRQRLKLKDGGDIYVFATTTKEGPRLFITKSRTS